MPFIDWNNDGKIDPVDIGISIASETEEVGEPAEETPQKPAVGCLTSVIISIIFVAAFACLWAIL